MLKRKEGAAEKREVKKANRNPNRRRLLFFILLGWALLIIGDRTEDFRLYQGASMAMYCIAIASIVLLTGYSGQISLGNSAFMAVGAYCAALAMIHWAVPVWLAIIISALTGALAGAILGGAASRLSGPYLAGTTLALAVGLPILANEFEVLGGEQGLFFDIGMTPAFLGPEFSFDKWMFWICTFVALLTLWMTQNVLKSRYGRTWRALRGNPSAAQLSGINVARSKVLAFTLSAALAGISGALTAITVSLVAPSVFTLSLSFLIVTGAIIAGVTSLTGVVLGAFTLVVIPELAELLAGRFSDAEAITSNLPGLLISVLLVLAVIFTPNGPQEAFHKHREHKEKDHKNR